MPIYNLYFMNGRGHIDRIEHVDAVGDDIVIRATLEKEGRQPIEIWSEHRKVYRIEAIAAGDRQMRIATDYAAARRGLAQPPAIGQPHAE